MQHSLSRPVCEVLTARPPAQINHLLHLLDEVERGRLERIRKRTNAITFVAAAALLRLTLSSYGAGPPREIPIDRTCPDCGRPHGRPRVTGGPCAALDVSVAHTSGAIAVSATPAGRVGVDVEAVPADHEALLTTACHPTERLAISDAADFARVWVRKEAVMKAHGAGLRLDPAQVVVSGPAEPPRLLAFQSVAPVPSAQLSDFVVDGGVVGAVAVLVNAPVRIHLVNATGTIEP